MKKLIFICSMVLPLLSCKKEQPQPNNGLENCSCAHEVSADFTIEEMTTGNEYFAKYTETDAIFGDKNVRFTAKESDAEYTWYIGSEVITTKEFKRYFGNAHVGETISVSLVIKKKPNLICFPTDDGYDSITKTFLVAQLDLYSNLDTTFLEGTYRMKSPLLSDSIDIIIDHEYYIGVNHCFDIYNYNGLDSNVIKKIGASNYHLNYHQLWFEDLGSQYNHLKGDIHYINDNLTEINLFEMEWNGTGLEISKEFNYKGRKL